MSSSDRSTSSNVPSDFLRGHLNGFPRFVARRIVPPRCAMPRTESRVSETTSSSPKRPAKPRLIPSTSQPRLIDARTTVRMTAFSPGASPPPVESAMRMTQLLLEQLQYLAWPRMPIQLRLFEDRSTIPRHFEASLPGRNHLYLRTGIRRANFGRQTDGPRLVVSKRAVFDRDGHDVPSFGSRKLTWRHRQPGHRCKSADYRV